MALTSKDCERSKLPREVATCILLLCALMFAAPGLAVPPVNLEDCDLDADELTRLIGIETADATVRSASAALGQMQIKVRCDHDVTHVHVGRLGDAHTAHTALDLAASPAKARPRIVALAVADLLAWSQATRDPTPASKSPPESGARPTSVVNTTALPPSQETRWHMLTGVQWRTFATHDLHLVRVAPSLLRQDTRWGQELAVAFERGWQKRALADAVITNVNLAGLLWWQHRKGTFAVRVGAGLEVGRTSMRGQPSHEGRGMGVTHTAFTLAPLATAALRYHSGHTTAFELRITGGHVVEPVIGLIAETEEVRMGGPWVGAALLFVWGANRP